MVGAFLVGKSYGEKTYLESEEYKKIAAAREELDYAKYELEKATAKLQNIVDGADKKKTDQLLADILQVFLADLGLRIQNKEAILKQAQLTATPAPVVAQTQQPPPPPRILEKAVDKLKKEDEKLAELQKKLQINEEMLLEDKSPNQIMKDLDKVVLKSLANGSLDDVIERVQCEKFLGDYRGSVRGIGEEALGTFQFSLKGMDVAVGILYKGEMNWYNQGNAVHGAIANGCGHKLIGLQGRVFILDGGRYAQLYVSTNAGGSKMYGNVYDMLPNHTFKRFGKFILSRTDKF